MPKNSVDPSSEIRNWVENLRDLYGKKRQRDYDTEKELLATYLERLAAILSETYVMERPFSVGGTGVIFLVNHRQTFEKRILKFNRPRKLETEKSRMEKEGEVLCKLNHSNIIKVIDKGSFRDLEPRMFYIIEALISEGKVLDNHLEDRIDSLFVGTEDTSDQYRAQRYERFMQEFIDLIGQWVVGLLHIHNRGFVYLDAKPENVLVDDNGHLVIIDAGSAEEIDENDPEPVEIVFTEAYAHPGLSQSKPRKSSSNRVRGSLKRSELRKSFDYYALGKSVLELLEIALRKYPHDCKQIPQFRSVHLLASRLLDAENSEKRVGRSITELEETYGELNRGDYDSLRYTDLRDVVRDLKKELGSWNPEIEIPELGLYSKDVIRVGPNLNAVLTERLRDILEHPIFARTKMVSQLGLVSLVYPTAVHSRYSHALGTYTHTASYIRALFHDYPNPIFRSIVDDHDIKAALLAALLHDAGQYPLAHDLEEVHGKIFSHSRTTIRLLDGDEKNTNGRTLKEIITDKEYGWGVDIEYLKRIIGMKLRSSEELDYSSGRRLVDLKVDLLSALIDGPIDSDKADYVIRDGLQCGVPYGKQLDIERLLRVITVAILNGASSTGRHKVSIGVYEKGCACARAFGTARGLLVATVYWHHTSRIIKAMLQYGTAILLPREVFHGSEKHIQMVREKLFHFVTHLNPASRIADKLQKLRVDSSGNEKKISLEETPPDDVLEELEHRMLDLEREMEEDYWYPGISWADWNMLKWIRQLSDKNARGHYLIDEILERKLYKRVSAMAPRELRPTDLHRLRNLEWPKRISLCEAFQQEVHDIIDKRKGSIDTIPPIEEEEIESLFENELVILVDVPNPESKGESQPLVTVPELKGKSYYQEEERPKEDTDWSVSMNSLMDTASQIRVLCHPRLLQLIASCLRTTDKTLHEQLKEILNYSLKNL